jgi:hypothetical protein
MITYEKTPLIRVAEFHYNEDPAIVRSDIVRHLWRLTPLSDSRSEESFTIALDLKHSHEELLGNMHRNARKGIRRAEKDLFSYEFWSGYYSETLGHFCRFYDAFARSKRLPGADCNRLTALAELGVLDLSRATDHNGRVLTWHAHYRSADRARLIYSASLRRPTTETPVNALIGRANCFHTWHDILRFQRQGIETYDFGGWYAGTENAGKLRVNRFKESFGGEIVREFNSEFGFTIVGRLAMALKPIVWNYSAWARSAKPFGQGLLKRVIGANRSLHGSTPHDSSLW